MIKGAIPTVYFAYRSDGWKPVDSAVIEETTVCLHVNGQEVAAFMCSPVDLEAMAVGFLYSEDIIHRADDIELLELNSQGACVDVWLRRELPPLPRAIRTSGCGAGITFDDLTGRRAPLPLASTILAQEVIDRYYDLRAVETLYPITRGVHASALCTPQSLLFHAEDVGRHNTLDKLSGKALLQGVDTTDCMIVTTGRISSEMLGKAAKLGVSIVASRTSPTSRSLALAQAWNITIIGYIRRDSLRVYTVPERIGIHADQLTVTP